MSFGDQLYLDQLAADVASGKKTVSEVLADAYVEGREEGFENGYAAGSAYGWAPQ